MKTDEMGSGMVGSAKRNLQIQRKPDERLMVPTREKILEERGVKI
jgi:hypothetical protein